MNNKLKNIVKKYLLNNDFQTDGNIFQFYFVEPFELCDKLGFRVKVNVMLPKKDMCYATPKFDGDIYEILNKIGDYVGERFSSSIDEILVNGEKPKNPIYITLEKQKELISRLNNDIGRVKLSGKDIEVDFNVAIRPANKIFYELSDININFYFNILASSFRENEKPINPNLNTIDDLGAALSESLNDSDNFGNDVEDIIYRVLEPEMKIKNVDDLYYTAMFFCNKIDGIETSGMNWGYYLSRKFFT